MKTMSKHTFDNSIRWNSLYSCYNKKKYVTRQHAAHDADVLTHKKKGIFVSYYCKFCNMYHVGTKDQKPKKQEKKDYRKKDIFN